jgi:hypothetical protein
MQDEVWDLPDVPLAQDVPTDRDGPAAQGARRGSHRRASKLAQLAWGLQNELFYPYGKNGHKGKNI